jgi:uncharacterized protein
MRARVFLLALLLSALPLLAAPTFPALSGRVVDEAGLLSPTAEAQLTQELADHERKSREQLVVVTVPSLQGYPIEDFGYQLGRHWGIGQAKLNNGAILLVAPNERQVRIEVGYGLEGRLTDVLSHDIIQTQILPQFRQGQFELGIVSGARAVLAVLQGSYEPQARATPATEHLELPRAAFALGALGLFMLGLAPFLAALAIGAAAGLVVWALTHLGWLAIIAGLAVFALLLAAPRGGSGRRGRGFGYPGGFGGGMGGGGFSGGGGGFGGGGASGRW